MGISLFHTRNPAEGERTLITRSHTDVFVYRSHHMPVANFSRTTDRLITVNKVLHQNSRGQWGLARVRCTGLIS